MRLCAEYCLEMPDDFPVDELTAFMAAARLVLLQPDPGPEWNEFGGASNLIGWRYKASSEDWQWYKHSWQTQGAAVDHEAMFQRERALFGMFTAGVSCIESTVYALAALSSHSDIASIPFGLAQQRACSPGRLCKWLKRVEKATPLSEVLSALDASSEWEQWLSLRNRMAHRSNIPRIIRGVFGGQPPPAKALHFAATSSTVAVEGDLEAFEALHAWLTHTLTKLLVEGTNLCSS